MTLEEIYKHIQEELGSIERDFPNLSEKDQDIFTGWVEALEFVKNLMDERESV
jgi:formiminotetrahydrofolate cyclodeaminase